MSRNITDGKSLINFEPHYACTTGLGMSQEPAPLLEGIRQMPKDCLSWGYPEEHVVLDSQMAFWKRIKVTNFQSVTLPHTCTYVHTQI